MTESASPSLPVHTFEALRHAGRRVDRVGLGRLAIVIASVQLVLVLVVANLAVRIGPREPFNGDWAELANPGSSIVTAAIAPLERWDSLWFQHIAQAGYGADDGSAAFLPLYPALGAMLSIPLLGNVGLAMVLVACASYAVALWLLGKLAVLEFANLRLPRPGGGEAVRSDAKTFATLTMLGLATFPTAFFFIAPFTESLFLTLALATMLFARNGRFGAAAVAAGLATLVRTQGLFLALSIAWEGFRAAGLLRLPIRPGGAAILGTLRGVAAAAVPFGALIGWYGALGVFFGSQSIGLSAQTPWGYAVTAPWDVLIQSATYIGSHIPKPLGLIEGLNLACLLGFVGLAVVARRLPVSHTLYTIPSLGLVAARVMWFMPLMSVSRYVLVVFPGFLGLGILLGRHPRAALAWLVLASVAQVVLLQWYARWGFVA